MRNATSIGLFGVSALALTLIGACGGGGDATRPDGTAGAATTAGMAGMSESGGGGMPGSVGGAGS